MLHRKGIKQCSGRALLGLGLGVGGGAGGNKKEECCTMTTGVRFQSTATGVTDIDAQLKSPAAPKKLPELVSNPAELVAATNEVYNIFDKRNMKKTSPVYVSLVAIGLGAKDEGSMELVVKDKRKFNNFAEQVRTGKALIPQFWRQTNALRLNLSAILKMKTKGSARAPVLPKAPGEQEPEPQQSMEEAIDKMKLSTTSSSATPPDVTTPADVASVMLKQLYRGDESCLLFASSVAGSATSPKSKKAKMSADDVMSEEDVVGTGSGSVRGKVTQSIRANRKSRVSEVSAIPSSVRPPEGAELDELAKRQADQDNEILKVVLNEEQKATLNLAKKGLNMYIGGSAGTGKTVVLRAIKAHLSAMGLSVGMTATTGIAACNVNGSTFHHAMSVDLSGDFMNVSRLLKYDCIIIDEISMMDQQMLHKFDQVMQDATGLRAPFGGVQLIFSGDFLQLECVHGSAIYLSPFFQSSFVHVKLRQQVRQADHPRFAEQLSVIRTGVVPDDLAETVKLVGLDEEVKDAVFLMPRNKEVDDMNKRELAALDGEPVTFDVMQQRPNLKGDWTPTVSIYTSQDFDEEKFFSSFMARFDKQITVGSSFQTSEVAFYRFAADGFLLRVKLPPVTEPNRRIAVSTAFQEMVSDGYFDSLLDLKSRVMDVSGGQIVSIDSSTGELKSVVGAGSDVKTLTSEDELTLTKLMDSHPVVKPLDIKVGCRVLLRSNLSDIFVNGSVGVVVGFAECTYDSIPAFMKTESQMNAQGGRNTDNVRAQVDEFAKYLKDQCGQVTPMLPVVKFGEGPNDTITVPPWEFSVGGDQGTHFFELGTYCLPLTLAYAFTVHKVQGLTLLGRVHIKLAGMWKCHHLMYVAMSRVKNPDQLTIAGFEEEHVSAEEVAVEYDKGLKDPKTLKIEESTVRGMWTRDYGNRAAARVLPTKKSKKKQKMYDNDRKHGQGFQKESDLTKNLEELVQQEGGLLQASEGLPEAEVVSDEFATLGEFSVTDDLMPSDSEAEEAKGGKLMPTTPEQDRAVLKGLQALDVLKKGVVTLDDPARASKKVAEGIEEEGGARETKIAGAAKNKKNSSVPVVPSPTLKTPAASKSLQKSARSIERKRDERSTSKKAASVVKKKGAVIEEL